MFSGILLIHCNDVIMGAIASQITSFTIVYSIVYSDVDKKHQSSSASLAFVRGIHQSRWIPLTNGQLRGKCFHLMTSSCRRPFSILHFTACTEFTRFTKLLHILLDAGGEYSVLWTNVWISFKAGTFLYFQWSVAHFSVLVEHDYLV